MGIEQAETTNDLVADFIDRVLAMRGVRTPAAVRKLEREMRRDYGGNTHYIAKFGETARLERLERDFRIRADANRGERIPLLARRWGISEKRVRQIIAKRP